MKKYLLITGLIVCSVIGLSFTVKDEGFKNLKVLPKNITHDEMDSVMKHFAKSLGVKCNFCHVKGEDGQHMNFASDENQHKDIARSMYKMTARINKKFFGNEVNAVTCFSCHNGHEDPVKFPAHDPNEE